MYTHEFTGPNLSEYSDYEFFDQPKHKLLFGKNKGKRRFRKPSKRKQPKKVTGFFPHNKRQQIRHGSKFPTLGAPGPDYDDFFRQGSKNTANEYEYDPYLDLDYIEEMFTGNNNNNNDDVDNYGNPWSQQKPSQWLQGKQNGYSMIQETDLDSHNRSHRERYF